MGINIKPEVLTEVPQSSVFRFINDDRFGFEEKFNGKRRIVIRDGNSVFSLNKEGEMRDVPARLTAKLLTHRLDRFVIDCELMVGDTLRIFDALILGEHLLGTQEYITRHNALKIAFGHCAPYAIVAELVTGTEQKRLFAQRLEGENAEGIVARRLDAPYKQGDSGQHKKIKFWKTVDCVVIRYDRRDDFNTPTSVRIGCYNSKGRLQEVGGSSLLGKDRTIKPGDVVEIKCLYTTPEGNVYQPTILGKRDDKKPTTCTMDKLMVYVNKNWR